MSVLKTVIGKPPIFIKDEWVQLAGDIALTKHGLCEYYEKLRAIRGAGSACSSSPGGGNGSADDAGGERGTKGGRAGGTRRSGRKLLPAHLGSR